MATTDAPLLDLQTLVTRPVVRIRNGDEVHDYELRTPGEMSPLEYVQLKPLSERVDPFLSAMRSLDGLDALSEEDAKRGEETLTQFCERVLLAPADVISKLSIMQRVAVVATFTRLGEMSRTASPPSKEAVDEKPIGES